MNERQSRLHGNEDSLDDVDTLMADGQNGHHARDLETGNSGKVNTLALVMSRTGRHGASKLHQELGFKVSERGCSHSERHEVCVGGRLLFL